MFDAFGAHQGIAQGANSFSIAPHDENFQTIVVVEVNVQRGYDEVGVVVLQIGQRSL